MAPGGAPRWRFAAGLRCALGLLPSLGVALEVSLDDASVLLASRARTVSRAVAETARGPTVETLDGPIVGTSEEGFHLFKGIPYAAPPERFSAPSPRQPWGPAALNATRYAPGCIGSATSEDAGESEDCLTLNAWVPKGGRSNMPVIVYFHGGMNQHGCGHDALRQGDLITQFARHPTIFVGFDFRLGIFGWIATEDKADVTSNLGLLDQQMLLRWVQRNIAAFGGDPHRVALMGQSEGATIILAHLVSPGSAGLFHRALLHSPPADVWHRGTSRDRTAYMARKLGCAGKGTELLACLRALPAKQLWDADWVSEALASVGKSFLGAAGKMADFQQSMGYSVNQVMAAQGWHPEVDGAALPGEPRELIAQGRWSKVPVLVTTTKNESTGVLPEMSVKLAMKAMLSTSLRPLLAEGQLGKVAERYAATLERSGIQGTSSVSISRQMLTDKMWMCDIRSMVKDMARSGGEVRLGVFWHSPKYDPIGRKSSQSCVEGAACHASDMMYLLPQGHNKGFRKGQDKEVEFSNRYSQEVLSFVHGEKCPWVPFDLKTEQITFYDTSGPRVVPGYRREQCEVLDASSGELLPGFMKQRGSELRK